ncbi:helix-turn-helix domain-containing protein [Anaerocolumna xylanovorans]|uniref:PocR sensory domain-containing protein n=1 Tax=Anaerocolumna xylanovorans DSM 12503 TaxID=1121345 RepID=A0A1M7YG32_9FIRM|nr:helix-turn-helix domain-containing protein [Anaerocolumna xylanovorans]SHO51580.1 PocR sensory domain-containing protein [Anaerocolumna xylanovorans DSM 12503]
MQEASIYIKRIMDTFYKVTETGSYFYDPRLNLISSHPEPLSLYEFSCLGLNKLLSFLAETFSDVVHDNKYFAFFLHNNIICHVVFLIRDNKYLGAIVTEPILVNQVSEIDLNAFVSCAHVPNQNKENIHKILSKKKSFAYDKVMSYGTVLYSICSIFFKENTALQILKSYPDTASSTIKPPSAATHLLNIKGLERHIPSSTYLSIKSAIKEGDTKKITYILNQQSAADTPMYQLHKTDHIRSIKNNFIKLCSMASYIAVDAGAPYIQTLDMADDMILRMESAENITDLFEMMKNVLVEFAKAVSDSKKSIYSQPVRKILDYLYNHYSEKITLKDLSNITRLSTYYISNLIKSETGLSLNDNINKIRIEQSQKILLEKSINILEVAQNVGFHYQNHFAAVFKKYTGFTPSDYRNVHGINHSGTQAQVQTTNNTLISMALQQIRSRLTHFEGFYDAARVVDPVEHTSWLIFGNDMPNTKLICYSFWTRNEACQNCISMRAYMQNDTFFKLEHKNEQTYLVLAFPEYIGKAVYITEILKDISNQSVINIDQSFSVNNTDRFKDANTGFYTRYYIDKQLPLEIQTAKADNMPLTLIAAAFTLPEQYTDTHEFPAFLIDSIQSFLPSPNDWIGHYAGNMLLFVLHAEEHQGELSRNLESSFTDKLNSLGYTDIFIHIAEQSLNLEILEVGEFLYLLFAKLYGKAQSDT